MEQEQAIKILDAFTQAAAFAKNQIEANKNLSIYLEGSQKQNLELLEKNKELKKFEIWYNKLSAASPVEICKQCTGDGGFHGENGDGEECNNCNGTGVTIKSIEPAPISEPVSKIYDEPDLPF